MVSTDNESTSAPAAWRRPAALLLKLAFMAGALGLVARHLDLPGLGRTLRGARPGWLALAAGLFIASKLLSSVRLNRFFRAVGLGLSEGYNLRLYWLGMFYNLFLPGGIGGDGYKVYLLGRRFPGRRALIFRALLLDRLSGLAALLVLLLALLAAVPTAELRVAGAGALPPWWRAVPLGLLPLVVALSYGLGRWAFGEFRGAFGRTSWQAVGVQGAQVLQAWALLAALGAAGGPVLPYLLVFLASSVAAVLPLAVGGLGTRELTFLYGAKLFALSAPVAVSVSVLFYVITALVSLVGAWVKADNRLVS
ncbi:MAG: lysylphosphatidylglycerol synthase transmembrane domain-containing protein [Janthinobacterium lividum]